MVFESVTQQFVHHYEKTCLHGFAIKVENQNLNAWPQNCSIDSCIKSSNFNFYKPVVATKIANKISIDY